jgi:flagellar basal-body rod protein FlgB
MSAIYLSGLAGEHANWLSVRQSVIAGNVANANTPGYKAKDVSAFEPGQARFTSLVATSASHLNPGSGTAANFKVSNESPWDVYHSGGTVNLPREMMKAGQVSVDFQLNTSVMKSFHRMVVSAFGV